MKSLNLKPKSQSFISAEFLSHNQYLNAFSSVTLCTNVNFSEYKEFQWWASAVFELVSEIPDSDLRLDCEDCNICLKSKYFNEITVNLQVPITLHCVTSLRESIKHFERHPHWRRSRSVRRTTQVQWESTQAYSQQSHWTKSEKSQTFLHVELLPHNQSQRPLFSITLN